MGYSEIDFDKKLSDENREWLLKCSRADLVEENDHKFSKKSKSVDEAYQPPYTVAPTPFDPDVEVEGQTAVEFHTPSPVPPRPGDRLPGAGEAKGEGPFVVLEEEATVEELNVDELKDELRQRDLPVSGDKKELQKRLNKALKDEGG